MTMNLYRLPARTSTRRGLLRPPACCRAGVGLDNPALDVMNRFPVA